jgi:hypothetical protein
MIKFLISPRKGTLILKRLNNRFSRERGLTFIEIILYVTLVTIIISALIPFAWSVINTGTKSRYEQEVFSQARYVSERIKYEIRNANGINSVTATSLDLNTSVNPNTIIDLSGGKIRIKYGGAGTPVNLNANNTAITSLTFTNHTSADNKTRNIQYSFIIDDLGTSNRQEFSVAPITIEGAAELQTPFLAMAPTATPTPLPTPTSSPTPTVVQSETAIASLTTTVSAIWPSTTTSGNFLLAVLSVNNQGTGASSISSAPAGWTALYQVGFGSNLSEWIYYYANAPSQSGAVSFTLSKSVKSVLQILEVSRISTTNPFDVEGFATGVGTVASISITTSHTGDYILAAITANQSTAFSSPTGGFTIISQNMTTGGNDVSSTILGSYNTTSTAITNSVTMSASSSWQDFSLTLNVGP